MSRRGDQSPRLALLEKGTLELDPRSAQSSAGVSLSEMLLMQYLWSVGVG